MPLLEAMAGIVLASGLSRRFGSSKLIAPLVGQPLALRSLATLRAVPLGRHVLVHGAHTPEPLLDYARRAGFTLVENSAPEQGIGSSIAAGIAEVGGVTHAFVTLADMPFVAVEDYRALAGALWAAPRKSIAAPIHDGQRGHPVLFGRQHFPALRALHGDRGGGAVLAVNPEAVTLVPTRNRGVLIDIDTPEALAEAEVYALALSE